MDWISLFRKEVYEKLGEILIEKGDEGFIEEGPKLVEEFYAKHPEFFENLDSTHAESGYTRKKVICDDGKHAVRIMEWSPNCTSPIHEHGGRVCFDIVIGGEIEVTNVKPVKIEGDKYKLEELKKFKVGPGGIVTLNPAKDETQVHMVHCPGRVSKSLHFYPVDHKAVGVYKSNDDGTFKRIEHELSDD